MTALVPKIMKIRCLVEHYFDKKVECNINDNVPLNKDYFLHCCAWLVTFSVLISFVHLFVFGECSYLQNYSFSKKYITDKFIL